MNNIKELTHAYNIIQNKLNACQAQKIDLINKMSTKKTLLHESRQTIQYQYVNALAQDEQNINNFKTMNKPFDKDMVSIIGDTNQTVLPVKLDITNKFDLIKCQGWLRERRVWIQVDLMSNCIIKEDQVKLYCLPNIYVPESICLNSYSSVQKEQMIHLYYAFDLLPDILFDQLKDELKVYCNTFTTIVWEINWRLHDDISWTKQLSISSHDVIQAYFPFHLRVIVNKEDVINSINIPCTEYNQLLVSNDQSFIIKLSNNYFDLYGLTSFTVAKVASLFDQVTMTTSNQQELIKLLGNEYVALEHNEINKTRVNIATLLSEFTQ